VCEVYVYISVHPERKTVNEGERRDLLKVATLDKNRYACGLQYFENGQRWLPISTPECLDDAMSNCTLVLHNNWIVSYEAKVYRFKEHMMWTCDKGK
jgi:hypothetical protein